MARAIAECKCNKCGAKFEKVQFRPNRKMADEWKAWAEENCTTCPDCWAKVKQEKDAAEAEALIEGLHLPEIVGKSEKQVKYASDLRNKYIVRSAEYIRFMHNCLFDEQFKGRKQCEAEAKKEGLPVTAEVCPHHFTLSTEDISGPDTNYKMNPPLRTRADVEALRQGLKDNIMDVISTDHAPHSAQEKAQSMEKAPFGIVGLETSVALTLTELVEPGILTPMQMAEKMSYNPAKVLGIDKGSLAEGKPADITIIDPDAEYVIDTRTFFSKGKNTPFNGKKVKGLVRATICDGKIAYLESSREAYRPKTQEN